MDRWLLTWLVCLVVTALACEIFCLIAPSWFTYHYTFANVLVWMCLANFFFEITKGKVFTRQIKSKKKAVFISGCDSGFGYHTAKQLDLKGFHVFAGCQFSTDDGAKQLSKECSDRLRLVPIDVTKDESVEEAQKFVQNNLGTCELWAIVNNAGVYKGLDVEFSKMSDFVDTFNVNALGPLRVTKAFLGMLKKSKGRIINVNSLAGRLCQAHMAAYTMSKHASVAFTECLRQEMDVWGIRVISVEPEFFKTPMTGRKNIRMYLSGIFDSLNDVTRAEYGTKYFERLLNAFEQSFFIFSSPKIEYVTHTIVSAICLRNPCSIYTPCGSLVRSCLFYTLKIIPTIWADAFLKVYFALNRVPKPIAATRHIEQYSAILGNAVWKES